MNKPTVEAKPQSVITLEGSQRMWIEKLRPTYRQENPQRESYGDSIYLYEDAYFCAWVDHQVYGQLGIVL